PHLRVRSGGVRHNDSSGPGKCARISNVGMSDSTTVDALEQRLMADWPHLSAARDRANRATAGLRSALRTFDSADTVIVVSGSLARKEFTPGSDIDWTLLVDGSADPRHYDLTAKINTVVADIASKPTGAEGTFGAMVFSHDLIHEIGGEDDYEPEHDPKTTSVVGVRS